MQVISSCFEQPLSVFRSKRKTLEYMDTKDRVFELLKLNPLVSLASITKNGYPRPIPMKIIHVDEENNIWFATSLKSDKVSEFRKNPCAGIAYSNERMSVSLQGKIYIVEDEDEKRSKWNDAMKIYFPDGADSKDYCLLKFCPEMLRSVTVDAIYKYEVKTIALLKKSAS